MSGIENFTPKSFWDRREGVTGMVSIAIMGIAAIASFIFFGNWLAPFLANAFKNTFNMLLYGIGTIILVYVFFIDARLRNLLFYCYASLMRFLTSLAVSVDPVGICREYVDDLREKLGNIRKQIEKLKGQMSNLQREISANKRKMEDNFSKVKQVKRKGSQANSKSLMAARLALRESGRLEKSNVTLGDLYKKLEMLYRHLNRVEEASTFLIEDTESGLGVKVRERKAVNAAAAAINSAKKIISGDDYKKIMYDQAMEFMAEDLGNKVGEIDHFLNVSENFLTGVDLENGKFEEEGLALLEEWEEEGSFLLGDEKKVLIKQSYDPEQLLDVESPIKKQTVHQNQFSDLFS